jgi:hypothetical protein
LQFGVRLLGRGNHFIPLLVWLVDSHLRRIKLRRRWGSCEIKVKDPALANYWLERGTLKFAYDAVGPPARGKINYPTLRPKSGGRVGHPVAV